MTRRYIVSYEYLSGSDYDWHKVVDITDDPKATIIRLLDKTFGAPDDVLHVNNISWSMAYESGD